MRLRLAKGRKAALYAVLRQAALVLVFCVIALASPAATFEDGIAAYNRGDYAAALSAWRELAQAGHVDAQINLGFMYEHGQGAGRDAVEAVKWYRAAAEGGSVTAQYNLGVMYYSGNGMPRDYVEAAKWYRRAAEQGFARAQHNLALLYELGLGLPQDYVQAYVWFDLAASAFANSQRNDASDAAADRDKLAQKMSPAQRAEAARLAKIWLLNRRPARQF